MMKWRTGGTFRKLISLGLAGSDYLLTQVTGAPSRGEMQFRIQFTAGKDVVLGVGAEIASCLWGNMEPEHKPYNAPKRSSWFSSN